MYRRIVLVLLLAACAPTKMADAPPVDPSKPIVFYDTAAFDTEVARTLAVTPDKISVQTVGPVTVNAVPPRLNAWMAAVQTRGGNVNMIGRDPAAPQQQQFLSILLPIATAALAVFLPDKADIRQALRDSEVYGKADRYDMNVYYVPSSGAISEVVFNRRPG